MPQLRCKKKWGLGCVGLGSTSERASRFKIVWFSFFLGLASKQTQHAGLKDLFLSYLWIESSIGLSVSQLLASISFVLSALWKALSPHSFHLTYCSGLCLA